MYTGKYKSERKNRNDKQKGNSERKIRKENQKEKYVRKTSKKKAERKNQYEKSTSYFAVSFFKGFLSNKT